MKVKRNTEGIKRTAQKKREETFKKVEDGIQQLIKDGATINFNTVAKASGVSKAWLYREPTVKSRIEHLRQQSGSKKKTLPTHRASDSSKDAVIRTLKERIKKLDAENKELRKQNQVAYGQVLRVRELEQKNEQLIAENERISSQSLCGDSRTLLEVEKSKIQSKIKEMGVQINSTLQKLIANTPESIVETALASLEQAQKQGAVKNPGGFLNKAISDQWSPNSESIASLPLSDMQRFNEWWKWAHPKGLAIAATHINGVQHVLTADDQWIPFTEAYKAMTKES